MDILTQKGLKYIDAQFGAVATFAKEELLNHLKHVRPEQQRPDSDTWVEMPDVFVDINIWENEEHEGQWFASAYPMENIPDGTEGVQTNCELYIPLFMYEEGIFFNAEKSPDLTNALKEVE